MRHCKLGDHEVDEIFFGVDNNSDDGITSSCRACMNGRQNEYRRNNRQYSSSEYIEMPHIGSFTEVRHPDPAVMRANVRALTTNYMVNKRLLQAQGLSFSDNCMVCYEALKTPAQG